MLEPLFAFDYGLEKPSSLRIVDFNLPIQFHVVFLLGLNNRLQLPHAVLELIVGPT